MIYFKDLQTIESQIEAESNIQTDFLIIIKKKDEVLIEF